MIIYIDVQNYKIIRFLPTAAQSFFSFHSLFAMQLHEKTLF